MRRLCLTFRVDFSVDHSIAAFGEAVQQKKSKIYTYCKKLSQTRAKRK